MCGRLCFVRAHIISTLGWAEGTSLYSPGQKSQKIQTVFVRLSPVMEVLTGIMIAILIFYAGKLIALGELDINNFFLESLD